jgi:GDP-L-fucose synthase
MTRILVTGGTGQVGSELRALIPDATFISSKDCDLLVKKNITDMILDVKPEIVIHTAARVGGIIDNIAHQSEYYAENVLMDTNLIDSCLSANVGKFIGILSTCAYPDIASSYPMKESELHNGIPSSSNLSYGIAKRGMAVYIDAIRNQYKLQYCYVIPCNLYGVHDKFNQKSHFIGALLMKIYQAQQENRKNIVLFGTGSPLRQVLYAKDLARVIVEMVKRGSYENFNIAGAENLSIDDYAQIILSGLGFTDWTITYDSAMPDGQYRKDVDLGKFMKLFPDFECTPLLTGVKEVYLSLQNVKR